MVTLRPASVYLLAGTEQFLKEENLTKIKSAFLKEESADFNFNIFYPATRRKEDPDAGTTSAERILECAYTAPFISQSRLVLVRQTANLSNTDKELILSYVKAPCKTTCLILEINESASALRTLSAKGRIKQNFFAELCKYARVIFCEPLKDKRLFTWIKARVESQGKKIEAAAEQLLIDNLGNNLGLLANSLDNLILYIWKKETIERSDVEKLVGRDISTSIFELFRAVVVRDKEKALQILDSLLKEKINSSQILGVLAQQMIFARSQAVPGRWRKDEIEYLFLKRGLEDLQRTDSDIKRGRQGQRLALELLLVRLMDV